VIRRAAAFALVALALAGCASRPPVGGPPAQAEFPLHAPEQTDDFDDARVIGSGPYRYRFVLRDTRTGAPAENRPYALSNNALDLPFVADAKDVYQGVTDAEGRTDVFALDTAAPTGWFLRERVGEGPFGEQFRMVDEYTGEPMQARPYAIVFCTQPPHRHEGLTDQDGYTAYAATPAVVDLVLLHDGDTDAGCSDAGRSAGMP
jgi:hypothetical protein